MNDLIHLSFFAGLSKAIIETEDLNETFQVIMDKIGTVFAPLNWSLLLLDPDKHDLVFQIVVGEAADRLQGTHIPADRGIAGWIVKNRQAVIVENVAKDNRFNKEMDKFSGFSTQSIIGVPLKTRNKVIGVIELINKLNGEEFNAFDLKTLQTIGEFSAIAIEKILYVEALKKVSHEDYLTGVLNRRALDETLEHELEICKRTKKPLSIIMADIDSFKKINDTWGHKTGDDVLIKTATVIQECIRKIDYAGRYGGDEFCIILPRTDNEQASVIRDRINECIENTQIDGLKFHITLGLYTSGTGNLEQFLCESDKDMYSRKKNRKDPWFIQDTLSKCIKNKS